MSDYKVSTWSALLAVWSDFARAAGSLPKVGDAGLLRRSVPGIIGLQSITFALEHLDEIPPEEYCSGQDRAALSIRTLEAELRSIWRHDEMPAALATLLTDANGALATTRSAGYEYVPEISGYISSTNSDQIGAWLDEQGFEGQAWIAPLGKRVRAGAPAAFVAGVGGRPLARTLLDAFGELLPKCLWTRVPAMRQVYEQADPRGIRQSVRSQEEQGPGIPLLEQIRPSKALAVVLPDRSAERSTNTPASL